MRKIIPPHDLKIMNVIFYVNVKFIKSNWCYHRCRLQAIHFRPNGFVFTCALQSFSPDRRLLPRADGAISASLPPGGEREGDTQARGLPKAGRADGTRRGGSADHTRPRARRSISEQSRQEGLKRPQNMTNPLLESENDGM